MVIKHDEIIISMLIQITCTLLYVKLKPGVNLYKDLPSFNKATNYYTTNSCCKLGDDNCKYMKVFSILNPDTLLAS